MKKNILLFFAIIIFASGCGEGISPEPENTPTQTGFGGTITFKGEWRKDVKRTLIVAFKNEIKTPADFVLNIGFISDSISLGLTQVNYSSLINPILAIEAGEYNYVAVVQSSTPAISLVRADWFVVGVYYANGDTTKPGKLVIPENVFVRNINITCDFNNPPPQPPGG